MNKPLPKGQHTIMSFPRFGLSKYANRFPAQTGAISIDILGDVENNVSISADLLSLPDARQVSDFHCVTTWSFQNLEWGGYRFRDFYEQLVLPLAVPRQNATIIIFRGQDGARSSLALEDALNDDVLLAIKLDGKPLGIDHGAPVRLVAPQHYGYKSIKHLNRIEFVSDYARYKPPAFRFMDHPRARVEFEERGRWLPGWLLRVLYKPLIGSTVKQFDNALSDYKRKQ